MKKVININFLGSIIPIEETAYEVLQDYIASLRRYFAKEEGRDEIINDIESRIAEIFNQRLKSGAVCITDDHVQGMIRNMGRPEDFEGVETEAAAAPRAEAGQKKAAPKAEEAEPFIPQSRRLYRNEGDKVLGGVASGLAAYFRIDPAMMRLVFVLLTIFGGSGMLIYVVLWILLPSQVVDNPTRKRLFRDTEERIIAGIGGGLGKFFDINPAIPRAIFALPFILGIVGSIFDVGSSLILPGISWGTFTTLYIVMWIVLPEARTASEKLEMRGAKVDLNSIKETVVNDLQGIKNRASGVSKEIGDNVKEFTSDFRNEFGQRTSDILGDVKQSTRRLGGLSRVIGILIKALVFFGIGVVVLSLFAGFVALLASGVGMMPWHNYLLDSPMQKLLAVGTLLLFLGVPIIALLVWIVRRVMRVRSKNPYIGIAFTGLWLLGLFSAIGLFGSMRISYSSQVGLRTDYIVQQPAGETMVVKMDPGSNDYYENTPFDMDGIARMDNQSLDLRTARLNVVKSSDDDYHVHLLKASKGRDRAQAQSLAQSITFPINQVDSFLMLPQTFSILNGNAWRNQRVIVVVEVPVGKKILVDESVNDYDYFNFDFNARRNWRNDWNKSWDESEYYETGELMVMTEKGLETVNRKDAFRIDENENPDAEKPTDREPSNTESGPRADSIILDTLRTERYRYQGTNTAVEVEGSKAAIEKPRQVPGRISNPLATILKLY